MSNMAWQCMPNRICALPVTPATSKSSLNSGRSEDKMANSMPCWGAIAAAARSSPALTEALRRDPVMATTLMGIGVDERLQIARRCCIFSWSAALCNRSRRPPADWTWAIHAIHPMPYNCPTSHFLSHQGTLPCESRAVTPSQGWGLRV